MDDQGEEQLRVLAVDPFSRGFGYAVLEGTTLLVDCALVVTRTDKARRGCVRVGQLIDRYRPDVFVTEDWRSGCRRCSRVRALLEELDGLASASGIVTATVSWSRVLNVFIPCGAKAKYGVAVVIARMFPELEDRLPRLRKPWMTFDCRFAYFNATALGIAFLCRSRSDTDDARRRALSTNCAKRRS